MLKSVVVLLVLLSLAACHPRDAAAPPPPEARILPTAPASPASQVSGTIQVVSGANAASIAGARVSIGGVQGVTDATGRFSTSTEIVGVDEPVDVDADGFLPRRTTLKSGPVISMWPVANEAEATAIRAMVYGRPEPFGEVLQPYSITDEFFVTLHGASLLEIEVWETEAKRLGPLIGLQFKVGTAFQYDFNEIDVSFGARQPCLPGPAWGFCLLPSPYRRFDVQPALAADARTIRRVLASAFIGPNPLPGLMNADAQADQLTPFELQTIRMILQRPFANRWPDSDR